MWFYGLSRNIKVGKIILIWELNNDQPALWQLIIKKLAQLWSKVDKFMSYIWHIVLPYSTLPNNTAAVLFLFLQFSLNSVLLVIVNSLNKKHVGKPIFGQFCFIKNSTLIRKGRVCSLIRQFCSFAAWCYPLHRATHKSTFAF